MARCLAAVVLVFCVGVVAADDAAKKLLADLEGSYTPTSITKGGEVAPAEDLKSVAAITIKGDTITIVFKKGDQQVDRTATLAVDPSQKPATIDLTPKDGPNANIKVLGIVKVEKDTVTLCWGDRKDKPERPKDFTSTKEDRNFLIVMKRTK
jgi:uncharacterized protein (TIGR03067 family)